jgi:hypothetical protein
MIGLVIGRRRPGFLGQILWRLNVDVSSLLAASLPTPLYAGNAEGNAHEAHHGKRYDESDREAADFACALADVVRVVGAGGGGGGEE